MTAQKKKPEEKKAAPPTAKANGNGGGIVELDEAIRMLHTSRTTLYRWIREGRIRAMKAGRQWRFHRDDIDRFLTGEAPKPSTPVSVEPLIEILKAALERHGIQKVTPDEQAPSATTDRAGHALHLLFLLALKERASDIHMAPYMDAGGPKGMIRLRKDGVLHPVADVDTRLLPHIVDRLKTMAGCDVLDALKPQDGRIIIDTPGLERLDLRVCFLPLGLGPSATVRLLQRTVGEGEPLVSLDAIDFSPSDRERIQKAMHLPNGLIIFTGPTGSGKTTALYAALTYIAGPGIKIMSVEDPIEYNLPWVDQVQINPAQGVNFSRAIRSVLRSDPDVLLCGEIRDLETVQLCIQTALTGHLVLSSLHTQDAVGGLIRMGDMGVEPFLIGDTVRLVVAQRLVRLLCPDCARSYSPPSSELRWARQALLESGVNEDEIPNNIKQAVGCPRCGQSGYRGRNVFAETLVVTPELARAIKDRAPYAELRRLAIAGGMTTLGADAARKAYEGRTSLQEAYRVAASAILGS